MRRTTNITAEILGSVALRYQGVNRPRGSRTLWRREPGYFGCRAGGAAVERGLEMLELRRQRLEAILLISREPLNSRKLAQHAGLTDGTEARTLVRQLNRIYDQQGRAYRVEQLGGGFRLLTRSRFAPWLRRLAHVPPLERLSAPAMETLAVVAYRQPVLRAEIEAIRGVSCGEILRQLMERDLVRIGGRSDELGRPYLYTTTKRFLQLFGLQSLEELPRAFAWRNDSRSTDQVNGVVTASMFTGDQQQEQEKSEVSVTLNPRMFADEVLEEVASLTAVAPQGGYDEDEHDEEELDEEEDDDEADDDFEDEIEEEEEEDEFEDEEEDEFEEEEWEEVEDDEEDLDEGWDDDEEWDEDDEEFDDEEESDDEELEEGEEEEGADWE
ncbi:MAG: SMC-Scp complex subunit ScpB [Pirellulaceae bacterium]